MDYNSLRHFADSWGLVFLALLFVLAIWMALRPSARRHHEEARMIPLRDEEADQ